MNKIIFSGVVILALLIAKLPGGITFSPQAVKVSATEMSVHGQWMSLAPPRVNDEGFVSKNLLRLDSANSLIYTSQSSSQSWAQKHHLGPNPRAAKALAQAEARAIKKNKNPAAEK